MSCLRQNPKKRRREWSRGKWTRNSWMKTIWRSTRSAKRWSSKWRPTSRSWRLKPRAGTKPAGRSWRNSTASWRRGLKRRHQSRGGWIRWFLTNCDFMIDSINNGSSWNSTSSTPLSIQSYRSIFINLAFMEGSCPEAKVINVVSLKAIIIIS